MNDTGAKQQIVDKIKDSSNILVTVSTNPSVDELSAALGLTLLLNKLKKHATAVFSGSIPSAITFLDPEKTFENTVDSLRDFIIALDKEKADHLRYKVDGDVVKIFITPYRTTLTSDDLDFSQGDYNVELVLALGVDNKEHLDAALEAHGRILHDATVATIGVGETKSELGSIAWYEKNASSLSELLVAITEGLKSEKSLLDEQISTAFLTGIVAATDRFSNNRTSSRVMKVAADLMAAGANQQLIASKLEEGNAIGTTSSDSSNADGTTDLSEGEGTKLERRSNKASTPAEPKKDDGSLLISHEKEGDIDEVAKSTELENQVAAAEAADEVAKRAAEVNEEKQDDAARIAEQKLAQQLADVAPAAAGNVSVADLQKDIAAADKEVEDAGVKTVASSDVWQGSDQAPSMGGTLNATTEQAADEARKAAEDDRNHTLLSHGGSTYVSGDAPSFQSPLNASVQPEKESLPVDPLANSGSLTDTQPTAYAATIQPPTIPAPSSSGPTLAELDEQNRAQHDDARAAISAAFGAVPFTPAGNPEERTGAQSFGDISHSDTSPGMPPLPPLPDFSTLPPLPEAPEFSSVGSGLPPLAPAETAAPVVTPPIAQAPADPAQFKIPGQS